MLLAIKNKDRHYENTFFVSFHKCRISDARKHYTLNNSNGRKPWLHIHLPNESLNSGILKLNDVEFGEVGTPIETFWMWTRFLV